MKQQNQIWQTVTALAVAVCLVFVLAGCHSTQKENVFYGENIYEEGKLRANPVECSYLENGDLRLLVGLANGLSSPKAIHSLTVSLSDKLGRPIGEGEFVTELTESQTANFDAAMVIPAGSTTNQFECIFDSSELSQSEADLSYLDCTITVSYSGAVYETEPVTPTPGEFSAVITEGAFLTDRGFAGSVTVCNGEAVDRNLKSFSFNLKDQDGSTYAKEDLNIQVDKVIPAGSTVSFEFIIVYSNEKIGQGDFTSMEVTRFQPVFG